MTPDKRNEGIQHRNRRKPWHPGHPALTGKDLANDAMISEVDALIVAAMIVIVENQISIMMESRGK
jgi:hypothetical protein